MVTIGDAVMEIHRQRGCSLAERQPQIAHGRSLIEPDSTISPGLRRVVTVDDPYPRVEQVVGNELPTAIRALLKVTGQDRVGLYEGVEGFRQRIGIDMTAQLHCHRRENLGLRENFLAV